MRFMAVVASAALATSLSACGTSSTSTTSFDASKECPVAATKFSGAGALGDAVKTGKLTIGIKFDQPGLGQQVPGGGFKGFDVDVATCAAASLGIPKDAITFKESKSADRENFIVNGDVNFIVATYSITDKRKQRVSFAGPYFIAHQDLLVRADDKSITGPESLNGKKLCSVTGSTSAAKVQSQFANTVQLQEYPSYSECVSALESKAVDAVTTDNVILQGYANQRPGKFRLVGKGFTDEKYGIGLKKDDTAGQAALNEAITKMESSGAWKKAIQAEFGSGFAVPTPPAIG